VLGLDVLVLNFYVAGYSPSAGLYVLTFVAIAILVLSACLLPFRLKPYAKKALRPRTFFIFGFLWLIFYYGTALVPSMAKPGIIPVLLIILAYYALSAWALLRMTGNGGSWGYAQKLALGAGILGPYVLLRPFRELAGASGSLIVGIAAAAFLLWLYLRVSKRREATEWTLA
jgi:hypothetical protein